MSASNRARKSRYDSILPGALAALAAMLIGAAPVQARAPVARDQAPNKEFVNPTRERRRRKKPVGQRGKLKQPWRWDRAGNAIDGVGNYTGAKRQRRHLLIRLAGAPDSGRQWVRLRKLLRRHAPALLTAHPTELRRFVRARADQAALDRTA